MMKFPVRVCEHRKANEWKGSSESRKSSIDVSSQWNWELFLYGHERQQACLLYELLNLIFNLVNYNSV